jgi:hypothetical protein
MLYVYSYKCFIVAYVLLGVSALDTPLETLDQTYHP